MGSSASVNNLNCPANYDNERFNIIIKLFEKIDKNNNLILEMDEIKKISELHISNKIKFLENESKRENENIKNEINKILKKLNDKIKELKKSNEHRQKIIKSNLEKYKNMDNESKCRSFLNSVSYDNKKLDFWRFFTYMKDKTNEIEDLV